MDNEKIIVKIKKVLELAKNNPSPEEAKAAALQAQKLLAKYHIDMAEVKDIDLDASESIEAGYWNIFRFDPRLADEGKNPFMLDGKAPSASYRDFIMGSFVAYSSQSVSVWPSAKTVLVFDV